MIADEAGAPAREFVSGRRPDAFDQFFSRRAKQRLVVPDHTFGPESLPDQLEGRKVYLLDGRNRDTVAMEIAISDLAARLDARPPRSTPLGGAPLKSSGMKLAALAAGAASLGALAVHAAPALAGVSPIGVRLTPSLVGIGRSGHVALTFDDGPDPQSTPEFLAVLDELGWRATFFMLGDRVRRSPSIARDVVAAGHEVGVHGDQHRNLLRRTPRVDRA